MKTFLLGVGCHKGGTTWLHDYLRGHSEVAAGVTKEYHVFDALHRSASTKQAKRLPIIRTKMIMHQPSLLPQVLGKGFFARGAMPELYFEYFERLLSRDDGTHVACDITPGYAGLTPEVFQQIKDSFQTRGIRVRVIFIMRDPVERIWSAIRYNRQRANRKKRQKKLETKAEDTVLRRYKKESIQFRTQYHHTILNLERVFAPNELLYAFYESLFSQRTISRIDQFLGISYMDPDLGRRSNASERSADLSEATKQEIVNFYRDVYRFAGDRFGYAFIRQIWDSTRYL